MAKSFLLFILEGPNDRQQPDGLGWSYEQFLGPENLVNAVEIVVHPHPGIEDNLPCLIALVETAKGPPVQSRSAMAVAYINQEGTRSRAAQEEVDLILSWGEHHVPSLSPIHIPYVENWQVDFLSH